MRKPSGSHLLSPKQTAKRLREKAKALESTDKVTAEKYNEMAALVESAHKITPVKPDKPG